MATIESYETASGRRYLVRYRTPQRTQTKKRGFRTKRDAQAFAATVEVEKLTGSYVAPAAGRVTVGVRGAEWLARQTHLKASSARVVEVAWRVHVEPRWGTSSIGDIEHSAVQQWVSDMTCRGSGATTVLRAYGVLAAILDEARQDRLLASNPVRDVKLPRKRRKPRAYLSDAQVGRLAEEAGDKGVIVLLLAYTGLRWGELAGLHLADVDMLRRQISVHRNAVNVGGQVVVGTPKTDEQRVVVFPKFLVGPLAVACEGKGRDSIAFPNRFGHYATPPGVSTWFSGAVTRCMKADDQFPRVTIHDLRHTAASLAISAGANVKVVQRMLGHASAAMTLDTYADLFADDLGAVADAHDERRAQYVPTEGLRRPV